MIGMCSIQSKRQSGGTRKLKEGTKIGPPAWFPLLAAFATLILHEMELRCKGLYRIF